MENYYFKFDDYSNLIFTVDDKITTAEELKQGVEVKKEFYIESRPKFWFSYKIEENFGFIFKIGITKIEHNNKEYWTYNGFVEIVDSDLEDFAMNVDHFWEMYSDFAEEYQEEEVIESRYYDSYSIYGLVEYDTFKFSGNGVYNSLKEALTELNTQVVAVTELLNDKYKMGRAFIEHLESI